MVKVHKLKHIINNGYKIAYNPNNLNEYYILDNKNNRFRIYCLVKNKRKKLTSITKKELVDLIKDNTIQRIEHKIKMNVEILHDKIRIKIIKLPTFN